MHRLRKMLFWVFLPILCNSAPLNPDFAHLGNLNLINGQTIQNCKLEYRTYGKPNADSSNIILYPTWFGGTTQHMQPLIGPDKLIDSTHYYIITVGAIGNGLSTSPSNSARQKNHQFPEFTISDMVQSQYLFLTKVLGINHLKAVMGGSMGGMQVFEWTVHYPGFMDQAIAYVGSPRLTSFDLLFLQNMLNIIEVGWQYGVPSDTITGLVNGVQNMMARTPNYFTEHNTRESMNTYLTNLFHPVSSTFTLFNRAGQIKAMINHNVTRNFDGKMENVANRVKADFLIIVALTDHIINPLPAQQFARLTDAELMLLDSPCGHLSISCEMDRVANTIKHFLGN
ncbi:MAG: alpha/beta fold hydrolase [Caldithrix sp.]|nr:alpha/beta fold hydrolase [Caldithrix sp.]